jgi:hypothetical protein
MLIFISGGFMRNGLPFFSKLFFFAMLVMVVLIFIPMPSTLHGLAVALSKFFGTFCVSGLLSYALLPVTREERLGELGISGIHGLRKTDANSYTYFVDHPALPDGSPNAKLLRFFWEKGGKEIETILPLSRVRIQVLEHKSGASVEFCFHDDQKSKCSRRAALVRKIDWWFAERNAKETGFMYALLVLSSEEFKQEVHLKSGVHHF